ncbi:hypothetical protein GCM10011386_40880 [Parapedobacter defluvii]|uniref:Beta-galactosidase n=1 Tax=Parapedobacter defluvii TaxID=2045106 RepID=A0ABQ1MQ73_9SPHI|nr:hypothetical protein GCM10011386_40880 [Parapedobacter defluvii]
MKRIRLLTVLLQLCLASISLAQQSHRLTDGWEFVRQDLGGIWESVRPYKPGDPEASPIWKPVTLPHCFNAADAVAPDVNYYQGPGWYRTSLEIANPYQNGRTLLHFEGSGQKTEVYIYTQKVGEHIGGYDEWSVDITDAVKTFQATEAYTKQFNGRIPLSIRCDNSRDVELIPSDLSDFNVYGGLYRYLNLVYVPQLSIEKVFATATTDAGGQVGEIKISARLYNPAALSDAEATVQLLDAEGRLVETQQQHIDVRGNQIDFAGFTVKQPMLWSPDQPRLYTVRVVLATRADTCIHAERIGFRRFEFARKGPFYLNGERLLLRGTHRHEDHAGVAAAMTEELIWQEMRLIKEMGVNFIRLGHYQQSRIVLEACDSLGILVWEEIPWCRGGLGGEQYKQQARRMLTNMIEQHYNHPSVIVWGLGNENDWPGDFERFDQLQIRTFMKELNDLAHQLDPLRKTAIRRCDFCKDVVDVYSPSIWAGWYRGIYTDYKTATEAEFNKVEHFLHVEWGGDSHARRHSETPDKGLSEVMHSTTADERAGDASLFGGPARVSKDGDWSESYICNLIDWHLKEQETMPWLTGTAYWTFKDFSTPIRPENPVPYVNQKGVVERNFNKKESYYIFQSYWSEKPMAHIYGHSWPVRWGNQGEEKMVKVYSNCGEAELFVNGVSQGIRKRNSQDFPAAGLRWMVVLREGRNKLEVLAHKDGITVRDSITQIYQTAKWSDPASIQLEVLDAKIDTVTLQATLRDNQGILCLDAANYIYFSMAGDGKLLADLGTSDGSRKVQAYNGRAIIRIKRTGNRMVAVAAADNLETAILPLDFTAARQHVEDVITATLHDQTLKDAAWALTQPPITVTASIAVRSAGGKHDFYSEGDYWWPDPDHPDGPYIRRDGLSNPDNFVDHRLAMIRFSRIVGALVSAWKLTGDEKYVQHALRHVSAWFIDADTRMNPSLLYAQAIKGRVTGRGIGIIDTIHLIEVAKALGILEEAGLLGKSVCQGTKKWFADYLAWLTTHPYGIEEMNAKNNHGTCWVMQVAAFASYTGNVKLIRQCAERYKTVLLPQQMAKDGSFPLEIERTKPYGYSLFNLDAMAAICSLLPKSGTDLWHDGMADGRSIGKGIQYMLPFVQEKGRWPYARDVMYWDNWPVAQPFLFLGALAYGNQELLHTWVSLEHRPTEEEVIRNLPIRYPLLWL